MKLVHAQPVAVHQLLCKYSDQLLSAVVSAPDKL